MRRGFWSAEAGAGCGRWARPTSRGPLGETRANPAGLTPRQVGVLRLPGKGKSNAGIARRLGIGAHRDSHVAAVPGELGAPTRRAAAAGAAGLGVLDSEDR